MVDGRGPLPDSNLELVAMIGIGLAVVSAFTFFSGLDAQVEYVVSAPSDYFLSSASSSGEDVVYFTREQVDLMNSVSKNSLGSNSVGAERGFCGGLRNGNVRRFRLADIIESSSRDGITFSCVSPREITVHSQPGGSKVFSEEDLSFDGEFVPEVTCIQFEEISVSPVTGRLDGLVCKRVLSGGDSFEPVSVFIG